MKLLFARYFLACSLLLLACATALHAAEVPSYRVEYIVGFLPDSGEATVTIRIEPGTGRAQRLRFSIDGERHRGFTGDGEISRKGDKLTWRPGKDAAELRYRYQIDRERSDGAFDARMTADWALFRVDRLIPSAAVIAPDSAVAKASLRFVLPDGWSGVETAYLINDAKTAYPIDNPGRRFQRPLGWMLAGDIGARREHLDGMQVAVAAPKGDAMRRNDVLAVINTVAPEIRNAFDRLPAKVLIVGAGDPMWRGGLSGPGSLFLHADRPLISENGSSTLIHELVHVVTGIRGAADDDWIAEGVAEFYSIELLRRSGLLSESRADRAFSWMRTHGRKVKTLYSKRSYGRRTARAVTLLHELDLEVRQRTKQKRDLDDVIRPLVGAGRISTAELRENAEKLLGTPSKVLQGAVLQ